MRRIFVAAGLAALTRAEGPVVAQEGTQLPVRLLSPLPDIRGRHAVPGATAAISRPDGTVVTASVGLADVENGRAVTPATPMPAASIGKTRVAATGLALEGEGLSVPRRPPVRPWFGARPGAHAIAIGQPLHHAAGPCAPARVPAGIGRARGVDPVRLVECVAAEAALAEPGSARACADTDLSGSGWRSRRHRGGPGRTRSARAVTLRSA